MVCDFALIEYTEQQQIFYKTRRSLPSFYFMPIAEGPLESGKGTFIKF